MIHYSCRLQNCACCIKSNTLQVLNLFKTRTQICLCFPKKRESESFRRFKTLSSVKFVIMAVENCDTPPPPRSASFSIERFLFYRYVRSFVFLLTPIVSGASARIMLFPQLFLPCPSAIILLSSPVIVIRKKRSGFDRF